MPICSYQLARYSLFHAFVSIEAPSSTPWPRHQQMQDGLFMQSMPSYLILLLFVPFYPQCFRWLFMPNSMQNARSRCLCQWPRAEWSQPYLRLPTLFEQPRNLPRCPLEPWLITVLLLLQASEHTVNLVHASRCLFDVIITFESY